MLSICILAVGLTLAHCQVVENAGADDFMRHIRNPRHTTIIYKVLILIHLLQLLIRIPARIAVCFELIIISLQWLT